MPLSQFTSQSLTGDFFGQLRARTPKYPLRLGIAFSTTSRSGPNLNRPVFLCLHRVVVPHQTAALDQIYLPFG